MNTYFVQRTPFILPPILLIGYKVPKERNKAIYSQLEVTIFPGTTMTIRTAKAVGHGHSTICLKALEAYLNESINQKYKTQLQILNDIKWIITPNMATYPIALKHSQEVNPCFHLGMAENDECAFP